VMNTSIKILLLEPINPIDNPHRGSGDLLGRLDSLCRILYLLQVTLQ
jgi:hypothetical protein